MSEIPSDLKFQKTHEWVRLEADGRVRIGISDHAQELLGDIVYVELPETGSHVDSENSAAVVESVKAASDIYPPIAGEVVEVNPALEDQPELVNGDAYGEGWLFVVKPDDAGQLDALMGSEAYAAFLAEEAA